MKRIYFIFLSLLFISSTVFAQKITLFAETFETADDFAEWTNEATPPNGGNAWAYTSNTPQAGHDDLTNIGNVTHASEDNDAWIFSPGITLKAGATYDLTFWVRLFNVQPSPRIAVGIATATNRESVTSLIYDSSTDFTYGYGTTWREQTVSYTPTSNGTYYIGFHGITPKKDGAPANQDHALVDDITLEGPVDNNITLTRDFPYNYKQVPVSQNAIFAKIQNTGLAAQTNVAFSATVNGSASLTGTPPVASLEPEATSDFSITSGVTFVSGENTVTYAASQSETDEYTDDNMAEHVFTGTSVVYATEALSETDFTVGDMNLSKTFGNIYKIINQTALTGVAAGFGFHSTYSLTFTIALYRLNGDLTVESTPLFTKEVTRSAAAGLYTFPLDTPVTLTPGDYFLAIENGVGGITGTGAIRNFYEKTGDALALSGYIGTVALRMVLQAADCNILPVPATPVPDVYSVALAWTTDAEAYQYKVTLSYNNQDYIYITADKSITIENLPSETDFTWTVTALCDAIQSGTPVSGASFSTLGCLEFVSEGFNGTFPPACWIGYGADADGSLNSDYQWRVAETLTRPENITPQEGSGMIELNCFGIRDGGKGVLISPAFTHTGHLQFSFWLYRSLGDGYTGRVNIYVNTVPEIGESTPIKTVHRAVDLEPSETGGLGWYPYNVVLPGEAGTEMYIIIEGISNYGLYNLYLDNLSINGDYVDVADAGVIAVTAPVSGINLTNVETVTVTVKNFGTTELTNVPVKFEINGGEPVTETIEGPIAINSGEVSYTFTATADLSASVTADFTVKAYTALDGDGNLLNDTTAVTVTNSVCSAITPPWSENFNSGIFPPDGCWINKGLNGEIESSASQWQYVTNVGNVTPHEGTGMIRMNCYQIYSGAQGILIPPPFTHSGHLQLSFWMYQNAYSGEEELNIYLSTSPSATGLTPLKTIKRYISDSSLAGWYQYNIVLPGEANATYYVIIEGVAGYGDDIILDELSINGDYTDSSDAGVIAVTAPVSGIELTNAETVTVTVKNFGTSELTNVPVKFEINGGEPVTETIEGPIAINGGEVSYTFTATVDLSASATTDFTVKAYTALDGDDNLLNDTAAVTVTNTICSVPVSTLPWSESFENTVFPYFCWTNTSDNDGLWKRVTNGGYPNCSPYDGTAMLQFNNYDYSTGRKGILFTPAFSLGSTAAELSFRMYRDNNGPYGSEKDSVNVYIASSLSTAGATLLTTIYRCKDYAPVESAEGWYQYKVTIPGGSGVFYIGIEGVSDWGNNTYLDDIKLIPITNITVTDKSTTPVAIDAPVTVTFDKEIDTNGAYDLSGITLKQDGAEDNLITDDITVSGDKKTITINHADFEYGTFYQVAIPADAIKGLVNMSGNPGYSFSFETSSAPLVPVYDPADNATDVAVDAPITITFNRHPNLILEGRVQAPKILHDVIKVKDTGVEVPSSASGSTSTDVITITPDNNLAYDTEYTVTIPVGGLIRAEDYNEALTWSFKTIAALEVTELVPADNSTVDLDETSSVFIQVQFNRAITLGDTATIKATVNDVAYPVTRQDQDAVLRIDVPENYFEPETGYTVVIPAGLVTEIANSVTWSFTTAPALTVVAKTPAADAEDVALDAEVSVEFNKDVATVSGTLPAATIAAGEVTVGNVSYSVDESGKKLVLTHDPFAYNTTYTVTIPDGALTAYREALTWSFKTTTGESIEQVSNKPSVYPTLSKGKVTVNSAPESIVSVLDVFGKTIAVYQSTGELELDLNYANGVYLIIINDGRIATHKVILQK
ncbi:MAG: choice-of-anchor J domain-containing protein [Dysgonamonadaceae bacterium]|jgi:hypothetical protein|nr:choice-of-anchor J domain-containing protein [Dysgonamonadaceae bacterium]